MKYKYPVLAALLAVLVLWVAWGNTALEVTEHTVASASLPEGFQGYRIAQISDLHNAAFGPGNGELLSLLRQEEPELIVLTGDLIDSSRPGREEALALCAGAVELAPCYYVPGNHEALSREYEALKEELETLGVTVLENEAVTLERAGETITLLGVPDPQFGGDYLAGEEGIMDRWLTEGMGEGYTILLSHRPELFDCYAAHGADLVFAGHAHGGQFRLPLVGGLIAPDQGFFPRYDGGRYEAGETTMLVSRGLGNSVIPFRLNNRPEVVLAELTCR